MNGTGKGWERRGLSGADCESELRMAVRRPVELARRQADSKLQYGGRSEPALQIWAPPVKIRIPGYVTG